MAFIYLTKNGVDNTNITGAEDSYFNTGKRDGAVDGVGTELLCQIASSNVVSIGTGELRIAGHRIQFDDIVSISFTSTPETDIRYAIIAHLEVTSGTPVLTVYAQTADTALVQQALYTDMSGDGVYEVEICRVTFTSAGILEDIIRTIDSITGSSGGGSTPVEVGDVTTTTLAAGLDADVDVELNPDTDKLDFHFGVPKGADGNISDVQVSGISQVSSGVANIIPDSKPTSGSSDVVTSDGVYWNTMPIYKKNYIDVTADFNDVFAKLKEGTYAISIGTRGFRNEGDETIIVSFGYGGTSKVLGYNKTTTNKIRWYFTNEDKHYWLKFAFDYTATGGPNSLYLQITPLLHASDTIPTMSPTDTPASPSWTELTDTTVNTNEAQTISAVKTYTASPIVPTPTTDYQAATKKYVDDNSSNPFNRSWSSGTSGSLTLTETGTYEFKAGGVSVVIEIESLSNIYRHSVDTWCSTADTLSVQIIKVVNGVVSNVLENTIISTAVLTTTNLSGTTIYYRKLST